MSNADELERLVALKEKGALSQEEFERAKQALLSSPKSSPESPKSAPEFDLSGMRVNVKSSILGKAFKVVLAIGLVFVAGSIWYYKISTNGTGIPMCDSTASTDTLKGAFDGSPFAKAFNLTVLEIAAVKETKYDEAKKTRFCTARITLNNTNTTAVDFSMARRDNGQFMLQFEIVRSTNAPASPQVNAPPTQANLPVSPQANESDAPVAIHNVQESNDEHKTINLVDYEVQNKLNINGEPYKEGYIVYTESTAGSKHKAACGYTVPLCDKLVAEPNKFKLYEGKKAEIATSLRTLDNDIREEVIMTIKVLE